MANSTPELGDAGGFIRRASGFTFVLVCVVSGLLGGSLLFLILGSIAAALELSPGNLALIALSGFLVGLVAPIAFLRQRRKLLRRPRESANVSGSRPEPRCRRECGWNLFGAVSGTMKLSDQAATSTS
jgi:hypothetical protein